MACRVSVPFGVRIAVRTPAASTLRAAFIAAAAAWAALLVVAPWLASQPHASPIASALILAVYGIGSLVCHQLPERSYHLWSAQMPVCARCAGIYAGAVVGAAFALRASASLRRRDSRAARPRRMLALAVTPTLITLVYEWSTGVMPSHAIRAAAGFPIGLVVAWLVVAAADNQVN
jgi:uncharacterized membrane protein